MRMFIETNYQGGEQGEAQAYWLAILSSYAYLEKDKLGIKLAEIGIKEWQFIANLETDTQGFVASTADANFVIFRGTTNIHDWKMNLKLSRKKFLKGRVHRGFFAAYKSIRQDIKRGLESFSNNTEKPSWFAGHSLGGALATIASSEHLYNNQKLGGLYTFGSPRVFNRKAANWIIRTARDRSFRYVNNNDIITRVPFTRRFKHIAQFRYFDEEGGLYSDIGKWRKLKDRIRGARKDLFEIGSDGRKDHGIKNYINNLERHV